MDDNVRQALDQLTDASKEFDPTALDGLDEAEVADVVKGLRGWALMNVSRGDELKETLGTLTSNFVISRG